MGWERELAAANRAKDKARRDELKRQKELAKPVRPKRLLQAEIWLKVETAVGESFPDGDPIDYLYRWMDAHDIQIDAIDRAVNRYAKVKKGLYDYVARLWDDRQADEMAGATPDGPYENNPFWYIQDGKVVPYSNPWKPT